ncbi:type VII secretion protein EccB [Mycobacteroides chelonae]|uniref:type VII secretion protein EccB n=1 Tax=Mycobacteroides TaxID=670516 RepID=UPI0009948863|nr:type VII secretion protein EccB [Mycobacteroides chelonae]
MPAQVTTRAQVNGYRFLLRRLEHALIRADSRMIHDPMRGQMRSLVVGLVVGIIITGACGVLAFFKPSPSIGNAQILLTKQGGAMYVRIGDNVHPVLNLASARLISGKADNPAAVDEKKLGALPRGSIVGIIGAPNAIHGGDDLSTSHWAVCDTFTTTDIRETVGSSKLKTTVLANKPDLGKEIRAAGPADMLLVGSADNMFLIYDGVRAPIDVTDPIVVKALHLEQAPVREISPGLLNAFPRVEPIKRVLIDGIGDVSNIDALRSSGVRIGSIVETEDSNGKRLFVVLRDGIQPVSPATADIIRYGDPTGQVREIRKLPPVVASMTPTVHTLPIDKYPQVTPVIAPLEPDRVVCQAWEKDNGAPEAKMRLLLGHRLPIPQDAMPVQLATADGNGPGLDEVYLKPGTGEYVMATGGEEDSRAYGQQFYVSDTGQIYHIKDFPSAAALGVTGWTPSDKKDTQHPQDAPWPIIKLLPPGPELSQQAALIAHDGMVADPNGLKINPPK